MLKERTPDAIAGAVTELLANRPERGATRAYAEGFSWEATTRGQIDLFTEILEKRRAPLKSSITIARARRTGSSSISKN